MFSDSIQSISPRHAGFILSLLLTLPGHGGGILRVDQGSSGTPDGSTWANAFTDLQTALATAVAGDQIWVADGVYKPDVGQGQTAGSRTATFRLKSGVELYGGFPPGGGDGTFTARNADPEISNTILSGDLLGNDQPGFAGNADNSYHVVTGIGADATALLDGFRITAANGHGVTSFNDGRGGGITCFAPVDGSEPANPRIHRCHFTANTGSQGSAIYVRNSSPSIQDCRFQNNHVDDSGAVYVISALAGMELKDSAFTGNTGGDFSTGAALFLSTTELAVSGSVFSDNVAGIGGSVALDASTKATFSNCDFRGNVSRTLGGGAIYNSFSTVTLEDCHFEGNQAESGAAIFYRLAASNKATRCVFRNNTAEVSGGGIDGSGGSLNLTECEFTGNAAASGGGGVSGHGGTVSLAGCRFEGNSAAFGGGFTFSGASQVTASRCLFRGNRAAENGGAIWTSLSTLTLTNSAFSGNAAAKGGGLSDYNSPDLTVTSCSFQGNRADTAGGAIHCEGTQAAFFTNCLVWKNAAAGQTGMPAASLDVAGTSPAFHYSVLEHFSASELDETGSHNFDGTDPAFIPAALHMVHPLSAPQVSGDLRLAAGSFGIDAGYTAASQGTTDLAGASRVQGAAVDLGAYEGGFPVRFQSLFPGLDPEGDANGDGVTNFTDYAAGKDPLVRDNLPLISMDGTKPVIRRRAGAADIQVLYQSSETLDHWTTLGAGDFTSLVTSTSGSQEAVTLTLIPSGTGMPPQQFYRAIFLPLDE